MYYIDSHRCHLGQCIWWDPRSRWQERWKTPLRLRMRALMPVLIKNLSLVKLPDRLKNCNAEELYAFQHWVVTSQEYHNV